MVTCLNLFKRVHFDFELGLDVLFVTLGHVVVAFDRSNLVRNSIPFSVLIGRLVVCDCALLGTGW